MPLIQDNDEKSIQANIKKLIKEGKTREQAVAIALQIAREAKRRKR